MNGDQFVDEDVRVDLGGLQVGVAQHFLDVTDVRAPVKQVGYAGMAQQVRAVGLMTRANWM